MTSLPMNIASTIQSASINRSPSPHHDLNPSTAASQKQPVTLRRHHSPSPDSPTSSRSRKSTIPFDAIRPLPRRANLPPLPDLRFEQSYLASLANTKDWRGVMYITVRDQVVLPLVQGLAWTLVLSGWRHWNKQWSWTGRGVGVRIRKWWWSVNNWEIPEENVAQEGVEKLADEVSEFYKSQLGAGGD